MSSNSSTSMSLSNIPPITRAAAKKAQQAISSTFSNEQERPSSPQPKKSNSAPNTPTATRTTGLSSLVHQPRSISPMLTDPSLIDSNLLHLKKRTRLNDYSPTDHLSDMNSTTTGANSNSSHYTSCTKHNEMTVSQSIQESKLEKMLRNCLTNNVKKWCMYEWFYSNIDQVYFNQNEFQECLEGRNIAVTNLTRAEWSCIRTIVGKPRRFSRFFLQEERSKLQRSRNQIRSMQQGKITLPSNQQDELPIPVEIPLKLAAGQKVIAFHSQTKQVHVGQVIAIEGYYYKIKFERQDLPIQNVLDIYVMPHVSEVSRKRRYYSPVMVSLSPQPGNPQYPATQIDSSRRRTLTPTPTSYNVHVVSRLALLLEKKEKLLSEIKDMHNKAEKMTAAGEPYGDSFQQEYAWNIVQLEQTNCLLVPALRSLRDPNGESSPNSSSNIYTTQKPVYSPHDYWYSDVAESCRLQARSLVQSICNKLAQNKQMQAESVAPGNNETNKMETEESQITPNEQALIHELVTGCIAMLLTIQQCSEKNLSPAELVLILDAALLALRPKSENNVSIYKNIESAISSIKSSLSSVHQNGQ